MTRPALIGELRGLLEIASDDELAAFAVIARKVMGRGRKDYGATNIATSLSGDVRGDSPVRAAEMKNARITLR